MRRLLLAGLVLATVSCARSQNHDSTPKHDPTDVVHIVRGPKPAEEPVTDCRANIAKIVCLVDPQTDDNQPLLMRPCLDGSAGYAQYFEAHYDRALPLIQKMYCHLERLFIEKNFYATAYAADIHDVDGGPMTGGAVGIRQEVLDQQASFDHWLTWKEETTFGGSSNSNDAPKGYLAYHSNKPTHDMLIDYVLNHEFGHLFDFANGYNAVQDCTWQKDGEGHYHHVGACSYPATSFGSISWVDAKGGGAKTSDRFFDWGQICFYSCGQEGRPTLNPQDTLKIFQGLYSTQFTDTYASTNPMEDWAETFTQYIAFYKIGLDFGMETQGQSFDLKAHYLSELMKPKRDFAEKVVLGAPKYPGEF